MATETKYQILNPEVMKQYKPTQYTRDNTTGAVYLNAGVSPIAGTTKTVKLTTATPTTTAPKATTTSVPKATTPAPVAPKATTAAPVDPAVAAARATRSEYTSKGYTYLSTMEAVNAAKRAGQDVQKIGNDYFIAPKQTPEQAQAAARAARAGYVAKGYTYLSTMDAVTKAQKEGKTVEKIGVDYFIVPKAPAVATSQPARQEEKKAAAPVVDPKTGKALTPAEQIAGSARPETPNLVEEFNQLIVENSIPGLEEQVNTLSDQIDTLDQAYEMGQNKVEGGLAPMEILSGRAKELKQQYTEQRNSLIRERDGAIRRLETKYQTINTMMELTGKQYEYAVEDYNTRFTQNLQTQQYLDSRAEASQNSARANLNTIIAGFQESGKQWKDMSAQLQNQVYKMEMESGLPLGTTEAFLTTFPKATLLATVNGTDSAGNDIITFVYADENGNPGSVQTIKTGGYSKVSGGSGGGVYGNESLAEVQPWVNAMLDAAINGETFDINDVPSSIRTRVLSEFQMQLAQYQQEATAVTPTQTKSSGGIVSPGEYFTSPTKAGQYLPGELLKAGGQFAQTVTSPLKKAGTAIGNFFSGLFN